jgi:glycosidase
VKYNFGQWVIYEMNVGSFTSAGTFKAAQEKLSELKSLGIDIIWLMPIYVRDGGLNSPYAAKDFKTPNPSYGSVSDLKNFVAKAHELKMEVWLDWVPNHTANNHPWLTQHPEYYASNLHPYYSDVSQLNYENSGLRTAMTDILKYWIDQADVDGFRCDFISSPYIPNDYWTSTIPALKNYKSGKTITMLGEADFTDQTRLYGTGWDYDYAWWFQETALWKTVGSGSSASSLKTVCDKLVNDNRYSNLDRMVYLTNHDVNYNHNVKLSDMYGANKYSFTVITFTLYGMPLIYNGQELGGEQVLNYFTDSKINWNNKDTKMYNTVKVLAEMKHKVKAFKDGLTASERGSVNWIKYDGQVAAYVRRNGNSEAMVVLNLGGETDVTLSGVREGKYIQWIDSSTIGSYISKKDIELSSTPKIHLENRGYSVYEYNMIINE